MRASVLDTLKRRSKGDRRLALGAAVAGLALAVAACSGAGTTGAPASSPPGNAPASNEVTVKMTDFHLALSPQSLTPGIYTFVAVNAGQTVHAIEVDGPGVSEQRTQGVVQPGESARLTVTLQPGSYEMYCPVDGHKTMGMDTHFTVGGAGGTGSSAPEPGGSGGGY